MYYITPLSTKGRFWISEKLNKSPIRGFFISKKDVHKSSFVYESSVHKSEDPLYLRGLENLQDTKIESKNFRRRAFEEFSDFVKIFF